MIESYDQLAVIYILYLLSIFSDEIITARLNNIELANSCFEAWVKNEWSPNSQNVKREIESAMAELSLDL